MNLLTTPFALLFPVLQSIAQPLFALWLTCLLLPSPVVRAQGGAGTAATAQSDGEVRTLKAGEPVERELAGGGNHKYQIALSAGQLLRVVADQRGIDVVVALFGPDGKQLLEVDSPMAQTARSRSPGLRRRQAFTASKSVRWKRTRQQGVTKSR